MEFEGAGNGAAPNRAAGTVPTVEYIRGSDLGGGIGGILYTLRGGQPNFTWYNNRGDVVAKTGSDGNLTYQAAYEAFGSRTQEEGETEDRQRANTREETAWGGLYENMRWRDLETGTYLTRDPAGFVDGPNLYTYVRQNPWSGIDPDGLEEKKVLPEVKKVLPKVKKTDPPKTAPRVKRIPRMSFFGVRGLASTSYLWTLENDSAVQHDLKVRTEGSEREIFEHNIQLRLTFDFSTWFSQDYPDKKKKRENYHQTQNSLDAKHWLLSEHEEFSPSLLIGIEKADKPSELWRMYKVTAAKDGMYHKYLKGDGKTDNGNPSKPWGQTLAKGEVWKYGITRDFSTDFHNRYPEGHLDFIAGGPVNIQQTGTPGSELKMRARERAKILNHNAIMGYDLPGNPVPW